MDLGARLEVGRGHWLAAALALALLAAPAWADDGRQACDTAALTQTLTPQASAWPADASGHWLSADELFWAGSEAAAAGTRYRLYHAAGGGMAVSVGAAVRGADAAIALQARPGPLPPALAGAHGWIGAGQRLGLPALPRQRLAGLLQSQLLLVQEDAQGQVLRATALQTGAVLDVLYAAAARDPAPLGVSFQGGQTRFRLWAPTARRVLLCHYPDASAPATAALPMQRDARSGLWSLQRRADWRGGYYSYLLEVQQPGAGRVLHRVTDPYSVSLNTDSRRSYIADLADAALKPAGWEASRIPQRVRGNTDMVVYELHVRDFSLGDDTVPAAKRGRYQAFGEAGSRGMRHLRALSDAGLSDVHLLPVFDIATIPEAGCSSPVVPAAAPDSEAQQAAVMAQAGRDCFNWGYDPFHFNAPEGSYASDAADGATRVREFRELVMGLHAGGLRVGMDVVYNHMAAAGLHEKSVLDRIVPGYYHRYSARGAIERSTCCDNTATERMMMARLMSDSVLLWAREYKIASFRFDLMGHQPRAVMEAMQQRLRRELGREVQFLGEGWNFGEVADGARFVQASQRSLGGSGIGTFSDRARDAARGGGAGDSGPALIARQGWLNGLHYAPNALGQRASRDELLRTADLMRVGLAGTLRDYRLHTFQGQTLALGQIDYAAQGAGYAMAPGEVVNYVENHDNQTLFDNNALKLPLATPAEERARVQVLGLAHTLFSQGVAYLHAGVEILRSKSLDRNSYDSGDWFNRLDWSLNDNFFGTGLPPKGDNAGSYAQFRPLLAAAAAIKPSPAQIRWTRDAVLDLLRIRASSPLFRLDSAAEVQRRLSFPNSGAAQNPLLLLGHLDGAGRDDAGFAELLYVINASPDTQSLALPDQAGKAWRLHPVHLAAEAADRRVAAEARLDASGQLRVPGRSALVFVLMR